MTNADTLVYPRWTGLATFSLALVGLGFAAYLSIEHATAGKSFACPESATINCVKVTTSNYSTFAGMPVAYLGLGYFLVALVLFSPTLWRPSLTLARWARLGFAASGLGMVAYLVWAEFYRIHAICLWCTGVHITTLFLFIATVFAETLGPAEVL